MFSRLFGVILELLVFCFEKQRVGLVGLVNLGFDGRQTSHMHFGFGICSHRFIVSNRDCQW